MGKLRTAQNGKGSHRRRETAENVENFDKGFQRALPNAYRPKWMIELELEEKRRESQNAKADV